MIVAFPLSILGVNKQVTPAELHFLDCFVQIFEDFLRSFQSKAPPINRLYDDIFGIIRIVCLRLLKKYEVHGRHGKDLIHVYVLSLISCLMIV